MSDTERRVFCKRTMGWMAGAAVVGATPLLARQKKSEPPAKKAGIEKEEEVSPAEDLMREHGVLNRILLIYDEAQRRLRAAQDFDPAVITGAAGIIRSFIEDYHEKLEEDYLFPRFEKARKLADLVGVLRAQHRAGRRLTDQIRLLATVQTIKNAAERGKLADALQTFNRMYRPHEAREDTVLFPALHSIVTRNEYDSLGEDFEDKEHQLFGEEGFEKMVGEVAKLEQKFGIYDLARFTPAG